MGDTRFPRPFRSLRLYLDCRMFDFNVFPEAGGLLDQDPALLADWRIIRPVDNEHQNQKTDD